jgi:amidohydrolase
MLDKALAIQNEIIDNRRHIHKHPELSYQESNTAKFVAARLDEMNIFYKTGVARTGIIAEVSKDGEKEIDLKSGEAAREPIVIVRADMDALPIHEETDLEFTSCVDGVMHACGHDTHTAMVLGVAKLFKELPFKGTVRFLFQPAEEGAADDPDGLTGARRMVMEGACEDVSAALGLHQIPTLPTGFISIRNDAVMAAADAFKIQVVGKSSHAGATPELGIDAIAISAEVINAVHHIVSRNVSPHDTGVISIGTIRAGNALNVIADKATMHGTIRSTNEKTRTRLKEKMQRICKHIGEIHGTEIHFTILESIPITMNDFGVTDMCKKAAAKIISEDKVIALDTVMGTEDFAFIAKEVPSCFVLLGTRVTEGKAHSIHNSKMVVNEDALPIGTAYFAQAALDLLELYNGMENA